MLDFSISLYQAIRLPRAIRLFPPLKRFVFKILGGGLKLLVVFLIVAVFLVWFAVVSMLVFGYLEPQPECERFGVDESFGNFFRVSCFIYIHNLHAFSIYTVFFSRLYGPCFR